MSPSLHAQSAGERDTGFEIQLSYRTEPPLGVQADLTTTNTYPCEGYSIRSRVKWEKDTVSITILGFVRPSPCMQSSSEATGSAYLGNLIGTYIIRIYYRDDVDMHRVTLSKKGITSRPLEDTFTELKGF